MNTNLNGKLDKSPSSEKTYKATEFLKGVMNEYGLIDAWSVKHQLRNVFTWRRLRPSLTQSRLDHWFIFSPLIYGMNVAEIISGFKSDHIAILEQFKITSDVKRRSGLWQFSSYFVYKMHNTLSSFGI